jgi:Rrf2 family protein
MFSLSKKTEYGLLALIHLSGLEAGRLANVSEIAGSTAIPRELLAKVLSELVKANLAVSFPGPTGGFRLGKDAATISLAEVLRALENKTGLMNCISKNGKCSKSENCDIRSPMIRLNSKFSRILRDTKLVDFMPLPAAKGDSLPMVAETVNENNG